MTPSEAAKLLAAAAVFDGRDAESEAAARLWAEALADVPADPDTFASVTRYYSTPPENSARRKWLEPHHVRTIRQEVRDSRIPDGACTYPGQPGETGAEFVARRRQQLTAIADGHLAAEPIRQIKGGPHPSVADALAGIGRMPAHLREELAGRGITTPRGRFPEIATRCPQCGAEPGKPCRRPSGKTIRDDTHSSRRDAHAHRPAA
ncbi:hypothetical protein ACIQOW_03575 [Kitasatospora sp. NPDC091335]|uniref:zinc finger domain-containing protein n=1 Tax=Kitasatospora sp. NPDC091335 TaxID=3364085 RepID=UPI00382B5A6B